MRIHGWAQTLPFDAAGSNPGIGTQGKRKVWKAEKRPQTEIAPGWVLPACFSLTESLSAREMKSGEHGLAGTLKTGIIMAENTLDEKNGKAERRASLVADFYIDFLGTLVPGLFALILTISTLTWSATALCYSVSSRIPGKMVLANKSEKRTAGETGPSLAKEILQLKDLGLGTNGNVGLLLVAAYILGSGFYRRDPKIPDHKSAQIIWSKEKDFSRLAVQPRDEDKRAAKRKRRSDITEDDAQFPYFFLHEYLEGRGLNHLAEMIPWRGRDSTTWESRSKMFINIIKIRLQFLLPERCKDIVRNEAHVRLSTSVWYASRWLRWTSLVALLMIVGAIALAYETSLESTYLGVLIFDLCVLLFAFLMGREIEKFIHYMRVREVVYVLETAYYAVENHYDLKLDDLCGLQDKRPLRTMLN